jgi:hypothetical protein
MRKFLAAIFFLASQAAAAEPQPVPLKFESLTPIEGSAEWDWWQAWTAFVPPGKPGDSG